MAATCHRLTVLGGALNEPVVVLVPSEVSKPMPTSSDRQIQFITAPCSRAARARLLTTCVWQRVGDAEGHVVEHGTSPQAKSFELTETDNGTHPPKYCDYGNPGQCLKRQAGAFRDPTRRSSQRMIQHSTCASASPPCEVSLYFACMSAPVRRMVSVPDPARCGACRRRAWRAGGADRLHRAHRVAFDAGDLHRAANWVAGRAEMMFEGDFGCVLNLLIARAKCGKSSGGHGRGRSYFTLAAHLGA